MKLRNGFVSNSSTASFIVKYKEFDCVKRKRVILQPKEVVDKLKKFGFRKGKFYTAMQVTGLKSDPRYDVKASDDYNYVYDNMCNEDEVIDFLLENKIPFDASLQYDQYFMRYDGKNKIISATNFGIKFDMYGDLLQFKKELELDDDVPMRRMTVKQYKKRGTYR